MISATAVGTTILLEGLKPGADYKIYTVATVFGSMSGVTSGTVPTAATVAGAPTLTSLQPGDGSITATWIAPLDDGGSPILSYELTCTSSKGVFVSGALYDAPLMISIGRKTQDAWATWLQRLQKQALRRLLASKMGIPTPARSLRQT